MILYGLVLVCFAFIFGYLLGNGSGETIITVTEKPQEALVTQQSVVVESVPVTDETPVHMPSLEASVSIPPVEEHTAETEEQATPEEMVSQPSAEEPAPIEEPTAVFPLNINTAEQAELELLPGIGPSLAERIIVYRQTYGPFISKEQIMDVQGIGEKRFAQIEALITVGG